MKICFISLKSYQVFNTSLQAVFGWAEVQMSMFAKEFAKHKDLDVSMIVADYGQQKIEKRDWVKLYKSLSFSDYFWKKIYLFFKVFIQIDADVYTKRSLTVSSAFMALYCKIMNKKFIYMVAHDDEVNGKKDIYTNRVSKFLITYLFKNSILIVQNTYQSEQLKKQWISSLLLKSWYHITAPISSQKKEWILWVGRSKDWKRPEIFLQLAKDFPHEKFIMIFPQATWEKKYFTYIKQQASKIKNLTFIDFVPFDHIDKYFASAKLFVNTSLAEWFPNTYIQALKNNTPILSLQVDPDDMIKQNICWIVANNNYPQLVAWLQKILTDKTLYTTMQNNGFSYVNSFHNIEINANHLLNIIHKK